MRRSIAFLTSGTFGVNLVEIVAVTSWIKAWCFIVCTPVSTRHDFEHINTPSEPSSIARWSLDKRIFGPRQRLEAPLSFRPFAPTGLFC